MNPDTTLSRLFEPVQVGNLKLPNRIVMSPMTRYRANEEGIPDEYNRDYYAQRAAAGLMVSESNYTDPGGRLAPLATGLYTPEQVEAWRTVVSSVHDAGGRLFTQLVHCGRVSHPELLPGGQLPVAPSAIAQETQVRLSRGKVDPVVPEALDRRGIAQVIDGFVATVERARQAGFDGVELHAGSGFLHHQFLSTGSNQRDDDYGGSVANRCRFVLETLEAMVAVCGPEYVGIKIAPGFSYHGMYDADPTATYTYLGRELSAFGLAYVHVQIPPKFLQQDASQIDGIGLLRRCYDGVLLGCGDYDRYSAAGEVASGRCDLVAFGRRFIANPDLVERIKKGYPENDWDIDTFYSPGPEGFIDYPEF